jgi:hypothetical protein
MFIITVLERFNKTFSTSPFISKTKENDKVNSIIDRIKQIHRLVRVAAQKNLIIT